MAQKRRNNGDGTFGVDLNRNFDARFMRNQNTASNTYGGPHAFSEPETCAIKDFVEEHNNIRIALDYHSQGNVFFPAHKFNHEVEIEGTDLNVLCANMNHEIGKVTGRQYGIHRGKPPANLIHGSGREYYYRRGILATVVEVGTRNIPDYMKNMTECVNENIPALICALSECINYSPAAPERVPNFTLKDIEYDNVTLEWDYPTSDDIYFEIYRSENNKSRCGEDNLVAITKSLTFTDTQLKSGHVYFYNIRAVDKISGIKSPFSPELRLKTKLAGHECAVTVFPAKDQIGYLGKKTSAKNREHFGYNSMFVGVDSKRGTSLGVIAFDISNIQVDSTVSQAILSLYPMNRVNAKIENYGEWSVSLLDPNKISDIKDFNAIAESPALHTLGVTIASDRVTQGIWMQWHFNGVEREILQTLVETGVVILRLQGPQTLPLGNNSQVMQFDIGYGPFGGGLHYRPHLDIIYQLPEQTMSLSPTSVNTISHDTVTPERLRSGFDNEGRIVYGQMVYPLAGLPNPEKCVFTSAYVKLVNKNALSLGTDVRFTLELVELQDLDYQSVQQRSKIEYIGYEVSNNQLREQSSHYFIFDSFSLREIGRLHQQNKPFYFIIRATVESQPNEALVEWMVDSSGQSKNSTELVINYVNRRTKAVSPPANLQYTLENNMVRLNWDNPDDEDFVGCFVVRNRFHAPRSPFDGVKLYGGKDGYTYDNFGNPSIDKYYAVFSYDDVPNYSEPEVLKYIGE
nr:M14 family zinc carboxypeptidase [Veronia pacifica]